MILKNQYRRVFKIPIGGISKDDAEKALRQLMSNYQSPLHSLVESRKKKINKLVS